MSSYLTLIEFKARCDPDDIAQALSHIDAADRDAAIQTIIDEVEANIDGYCAGRYQVPLSATNQVVNMTWRLSYIEMCRQRHWNVDESLEAEEERIREILEWVMKRKYHLVSQAGKADAANLTDIRSTDPPARTTGNERVFDRNYGLKDF